MKRQPFSGLSRYLLPGIALILVPLLLFGCSGSDGSSGTSAGIVSGTVKNSKSGSAVAGVSVTTSPTVQGMSAVTTDANGNYSMNMPIGSYTLTFTKTYYTTQTKSVVVIAGQTDSYAISLVPSGDAVVNAGSNKTGQAFGASVPLSATLEIYDPSITGTPTWAWTQTAGATATISGGTTATPTVTLASKNAYKTYLTTKDGVRWTTSGTSSIIPREKFIVQPVSPLGLEEANEAVFKATATIGGKSYSGTVKVSVDMPFGPATGLNAVPMGQPVLLHGKTQASYSWSMTTPSGSSATLNDATTQNPDFTPDVAGKYTITEATGGSFDIYAGTWRGVIKADGTPDDTCLACHNGTTAADKFTTWKTSGHGTVMKDNLNNPSGHWSATTCATCHTVGFNQVATTVSNNGFDQVSKAEGFTFKHGATAWADTLSKYPKTAQLGNIQCENCHGPQSGGGAHTVNSARISISSSVCGSCHGEPPRHARFQQWQESGHGDFEVAQAEGWSGSAIRSSCAGCHTGQGFLQWYKQLASSTRGNGSRTLDATSLANLAGITQAELQPQTCATCHDAHDEGTAKGSLAGKLNNAKVRVTSNTSLLPAGFQANGVGNGALCITCHNSRNGEPGSSATDKTPTLHEDGDTNWGTQVSGTANGYAAPHEAAQGDVLMGHNAYYVVGARSKHSFIADTCTTCHMQLTNPPTEFAGAAPGYGTNHEFGASMTICTSCHGSYDGGTLQTSFTARLAELDTQIGKAMYRLKNAGADPPAGTSIVITYGRSPRISVAGATSVTFTSYLTGVAGTTSGYVPGIAKANWNYSLVSGDSSKAVHNPAFTFDVLDATIAKVKKVTIGTLDP